MSPIELDGEEIFNTAAAVATAVSRPSMLDRIPVIFVAPSFGAVNNGPAIYARYLWESFVDCPQFDFHLVAPDLPFAHPQLHQSGTCRGSRKRYAMLQTKALAVARLFAKPPIIHGNTAHTMWLFRDYQGPTIAQINDYDAANVFTNRPFAVLRSYGLRRFLSLVWRHRMEKNAIDSVTRIICNSNYTLSQIERAYSNLRPGQSQVIYKAVALETFLTVQTDSTFPQQLIGNRRILFVGSNWQRKGLDIAIRAVAELDGEFNDVALIVAGAQSQRVDRVIQELPQKLGIESKVQFLGPVNRVDLPSLFHACDLFTLPSREEAFGVAILEALASGLPVIATAVGGIPEILQNCRNSRLIEPGSSRALAEQIRNLLKNKVNNIDNGRESQGIASQFSLQKMIMEITSLYNELAGRHQSNAN